MKYKKFASIERKLINTIKYYCFYSWWNWLIDLTWKIPNIIERTYYGVGYADIWEFDVYLSKIILRGLKQIKKYKYSIPGEIYQKYDKRKDLTQKQKDTLAMKEWTKNLNNMIVGFESALKMQDSYYWNKIRYLKLKYKHEYGLQLFKEHFQSLWD
jgi:hypothetical protein